MPAYLSDPSASRTIELADEIKGHHRGPRVPCRRLDTPSGIDAAQNELESTIAIVVSFAAVFVAYAAMVAWMLHLEMTLLL